MREEVQELMQACETFAGVAHAQALTNEERELVFNLVRALEQERAPFPPRVDEEIPLAAALSPVPLID